MKKLSNIISENFYIDPEIKTLIIDKLKNALKEELNAWYGYIIIKDFLQGVNRTEVAKFYETAAKDELEDHAYWIMKRINELGGDLADISVSPASWLTADHTYASPLWKDKYAYTDIVSNNEEYVIHIKDNLLLQQQNERGAIETYRELVSITNNVDPVSNSKLKEILSDEEEHLQELIELSADLL